MGTKLITGGDTSALGGVYKMSALDEGGEMKPRMKISDNPEKLTLPGKKELYRVYDENGMAFADLIALVEEKIDQSQPLELFDPREIWKRTTMKRYTLRPLLRPFFRAGLPVGRELTVQQISAYRAQEERTIWPEMLRPLNPQHPKVDLSQPLWDLRHEMLLQAGRSEG